VRQVIEPEPKRHRYLLTVESYGYLLNPHGKPGEL
jgi:hypothetical protein